MSTITEENTNAIELKANIQDVCALVDLKANTKDVLKLIDEMQKTIQMLSNRQQSESSTNSMYQNFFKEQQFINENLCPLNCVA